MPAVFVSFCHATIALACGSVLLGNEEWTMPIDASAVSCFLKSSGLKVTMSTVPATPPSMMSAVALLRTSTRLISSDGSSE